MLTPVFQCTQDDTFVIITITLSAICKALEASFDIVANQFTFFCRPYYLRLKFNEMVAEGRGEHASYDLESNRMTVWVPKETPGLTFTALDNPAFLIATDKERARIAAVVSGTDAPSQAEEGEEEETEFVQTLASDISSLRANLEASKVTYGFANHFSGIFRGADADIVTEMVELSEPETTGATERRALRLAKEQDDFDEEAVVISHEDGDGDVVALLRYVPDHVRAFQSALRSQGVRVYSAAPAATSTTNSNAHDVAFEEEEVTLLRGAGDKDGEGRSTAHVNVWAGNIADFKRPVLIEELSSDGTPIAPTAVPEDDQKGRTPIEQSSNRAAAESGVRLAIPSLRPQLQYTNDENRILAGVRLPRLLFRPSASAVAALTLDILFAEAYDDIFTEGQGCCESVWNLCTLSPALSFLDPASTAYDACVFFARRALVYPLHRHFDLIRRVFAVVGTRLLLGRQFVLRALLRVYAVLSHSEHRHVLDTIFLEPLIAYWLHRPDADEELTALAIELHEHVTRAHSVVVECKSEVGGADAGDHAPSLLRLAENKTLEPITLFSLGLPFGLEDTA